MMEKEVEICLAINGGGYWMSFSSLLISQILPFYSNTSLLLREVQTKKKRLQFELLFGGHLSISLKYAFKFLC